MTARAEYTEEEWTLLQMTPYAIGFAMAFSDGTGVIETLSETAALLAERAAGAQRYPGNELVSALLSDPGHETPEPDRPELDEERSVDDATAALTAKALADAAAVRELLDERSHERERDGYLHWMMDVARATALASRHGGWLRRGPRVDEAERALLCRLADALGVEVGALPEGQTCEGPDAGTGGPAPDALPRAAEGPPGVPSGPISPE